jgi:hypothetical protein
LAGLEVAGVVGTLHRIAGSEGPGSQGRKLDLLAGRRQSVPKMIGARSSASATPVAGSRSCVFSELPDVAAAQRARRALPQARLLTGMSCSADVGTEESGHLVPNRSPTSSLVLLVGISNNQPATLAQPP